MPKAREKSECSCAPRENAGYLELCCRGCAITALLKWGAHGPADASVRRSLVMRRCSNRTDKEELLKLVDAAHEICFAEPAALAELRAFRHR